MNHYHQFGLKERSSLYRQFATYRSNYVLGLLGWYEMAEDILDVKTNAPSDIVRIWVSE